MSTAAPSDGQFESSVEESGCDGIRRHLTGGSDAIPMLVGVPSAIYQPTTPSARLRCHLAGYWGRPDVISMSADGVVDGSAIYLPATPSGGTR